MNDGHLSPADMYAVAADWLSPRRAWAKHFVECLDRRAPGGPAESHYEVVLSEALRHAGVAGLVHQHRIDLPGYGPARFDIAVPDLRWAIEVDVFPTHRETAGVEADERRDCAATAVGWLVSRVGESHFGEALGITVARLKETFLERSVDAVA